MAKGGAGGKKPKGAKPSAGGSKAVPDKAVLKGSAAKKNSQGPSKRKEERERLRKEHASRKKRDHGDEAKFHARQKLQTTALERELDRRGSQMTPVERCEKLKELAQLHAEGGRSNKAMAAYKDVLKIMPEDPEMIRTELLCLMVDQGRSDEAEKLLVGPLFKPMLAISESGGEDARAGLATVAAKYTRALLAYISMLSLQQQQKEKAMATMAKKLEKYMKDAHKLNPFVSEFIVFFPAFRRHFMSGDDMPEADANSKVERMLVEAVNYCCTRSQVSCWMDTDDDVRHVLREMLFEAEPEPGEEERPPLLPLPTSVEGDSPMVAAWRKARSDATDLWAEEMMADGGEEEGEEEEPHEGDEEEDASADDAMADAEDKHIG